MAPAKTGRDRRSKIAVIRTAQANNLLFDLFIFLARLLAVVPIKLTAPRIDLAPARWREKIVISTAGLE